MRFDKLGVGKEAAAELAGGGGGGKGGKGRVDSDKSEATKT